MSSSGLERARPVGCCKSCFRSRFPNQRLLVGLMKSLMRGPPRTRSSSCSSNKSRSRKGHFDEIFPRGTQRCVVVLKDEHGRIVAAAQEVKKRDEEHVQPCTRAAHRAGERDDAGGARHTTGAVIPPWVPVFIHRFSVFLENRLSL